MTRTDGRREIVESLLETIEDEGWQIENYDANVNPYEPQSPHIRITADYVDDHD